MIGNDGFNQHEDEVDSKINVIKKDNFLSLALIISSMPPIVFSLLWGFGIYRDIFFPFSLGVFWCRALSFWILLAELIQVFYYVFSGGSLWDREIRLSHHRPYSGLKLDFRALFVWGISFFLMNFAIGHRP